MKIKVIGCSGAEFPGHNTSCFLLGDEILFDAGSITNVLDEKAQLKIKYIFITHAHLDHIRSIPFLADNIIVGHIKHKVKIMSISHVLKTIKSHLLNSAMWPDFTIIPHPDNAILSLIELKNARSVKIKDYAITPYKVNHTVPAVGYLVEYKKKRRFFYTGDTGPIRETWKKIGNKKIHCLIVDVSLPNSMEMMAIKTGHLTPNLLRQELSKIQQMPGNIYITHTKPQHFKVIEEELERLKIKNIKLLSDGDTIRI